MDNILHKEWLFGKNLSEIREVVSQNSLKAFVANQITEWLYKKHVTSIDQMTNLSIKTRTMLAEKYDVGSIEFTSEMVSIDGTKKYLFPTLGGKSIESAYIPDNDRATLCVSSQAGCRMGCKFCMTARQGFQHNLTAGEILNQVRNIPDSEHLTNIVYMGMGEPLDNINNVMRSLEIITSQWGYAWSPTRVTLSTIGVIPNLERFLNESKVHLAVSLHNPITAQRKEMMPIQNKYDIHDVIAKIRQYDFSHQRRVSFEYIMFKGINDSPKHVAELKKMLSGLECRMNLIRFHAIPDSDLQGSSENRIMEFKEELSRAGILTTVRSSRGEDIFAACGMLSTKQG